MRTKMMILFGLLALAAAACSDDGDTTPDQGVKPKDGAPPKNDQKVDKAVVKPDTVPTKYATVCGYTEDSAGQLLTNHPVIVCEDHIGCFSDDTSGTGMFCVQLDTAGDYIVHATATSRAGKQYLDTYFPQTVTDADIKAEKKIDVGKFMVPHTAKAVQTVDIPKGGTYDLGGGVELTIAAGATKKPPLEPDAKIGAAVAAQAKVHKNVSNNYTGSGTLAFGVAFIPLETTFTSPVSYKVPASGLKDGDKVELFFMSEKDGKLTSQGEGEVKSGSVVNASGKGLRNLGWILVYSK